MLDITSYRRKEKYVEPLTVMRQLYYDYKSSPKYRCKPSSAIDPLARATLSVQKFNRCFQQLKAMTDRRNTGQQQQPKTQQNKYRNCKSFRKKKLSRQVRNQTGHFKQFFSSTAPFMEVNSSIKLLTEPKSTLESYSSPLQNYQQIEKPKTKHIDFGKTKQNKKKLTKLYYQMMQQKQLLQTMQSLKKKKHKKIRQKWIIENLYLKSENAQQKEDRQRCRRNYRGFNNKLRQRFQVTKQNIFPSNI